MQRCEHECLLPTLQIIWLNHNATLLRLNMQEKQWLASNFHFAGACPKVFPSSSIASSPQPIAWPTWGFLQNSHTVCACPATSLAHAPFPELTHAPERSPCAPPSFPFSCALKCYSEMGCIVFLSVQTWHFSLSCFWGLLLNYLLIPTFWWPQDPSPCSLSLHWS